MERKDLEKGKKLRQPLLGGPQVRRPRVRSHPIKFNICERGEASSPAEKGNFIPRKSGRSRQVKLRLLFTCGSSGEGEKMEPADKMHMKKRDALAGSSTHLGKKMESSIGEDEEK